MTVGRVFCHNLRISTELAAYLFDHAFGSSTYSADRQCAEEEDQRDTDQCRDEDRDVGQVNNVHTGIGLVTQVIQHIQVCTEEKESSKCSGTNTIAFCQSLGGVAYSVKRVGNVAHGLGLTAHLSNTAGIICDRAEGIHSEDV